MQQAWKGYGDKGKCSSIDGTERGLEGWRNHSIGGHAWDQQEHRSVTADVRAVQSATTLVKPTLGLVQLGWVGVLFLLYHPTCVSPEAVCDVEDDLP